MSEDVYEMIEDEGNSKECFLCDLGLAAVGLVIGCIFLYLSIDVLTKGAVTRTITRGAGDVV